MGPRGASRILVSSYKDLLGFAWTVLVHDGERFPGAAQGLRNARVEEAHFSGEVHLYRRCSYDIVANRVALYRETVGVKRRHVLYISLVLVSLVHILAHVSKQ